MSSCFSRTGKPGPPRIMALMSEPGMSMLATESPNSYGLVLLQSRRPLRRRSVPGAGRCATAASLLKIRSSSLPWNSRYALGVS